MVDVRAVRWGLKFLAAPEGKKGWFYVQGTVPSHLLSFLTYQEALKHFKEEQVIPETGKAARASSEEAEDPDPFRRRRRLCPPLRNVAEEENPLGDGLLEGRSPRRE